MLSAIVFKNVSILCGCTMLLAAPMYATCPPVATFSLPAEVYDGPTRPNFAELSRKLQDAYDYCWENELNTEVAIFIDLGMHSGYFRCWVIGFADGVIQMRGQVAHGSGKANWMPMGTRQYSNEKGSLLSSLGKYKTGEAYQGKYGLAYRLHGLDASNSNAFARAIVLHAHDAISDVQSTKPLFQSWGCPTVSHSYLQQLHRLISHSETPLLLWIFDSSRP